MVRYRFLIPLLLVLATHAKATERVELGDVSIMDQYQYNSSFFEEVIQYKVSLPYYYNKDPDHRFPVIYVLDGHVPNVRSVSGISSELWGQSVAMPAAIVVGILSNNRGHDYTPIPTDLDHNGQVSDYSAFGTAGGAARYLEFLKSDFIPHIEQLYRTNGHNILIGHSLGGLLVFKDMLATNRLFHSYIAVDPSLWYADGYILDALAGSPDRSLHIPGGVFVSNALRGISPADPEAEAVVRQKKGRFQRLKDLLRAKLSTQSHWKVQDFPSEDHGSVVVPSHYYGLKHLFKGYLPLQADDPTTSKATGQVAEYFASNPEALDDHYKTYSARIGVPYSREQRLVEFAAGRAMYNKNYNAAYTLLQMNIENHPKLAFSWIQLGQFYERTDKTVEALAAYRRAHSLDPDDPRASRKVAQYETAEKE